MSGPPTDHTGPCATYAEKVAAFEAATQNEWARLTRAAKYIAFRIRGRVNDADADDLLQELAARIYDEKDERDWYPAERTFLSFAAGVMSSDASNWARPATIVEEKITDEPAGDEGLKDGTVHNQISKRPRFTELPDDIPSFETPEEQLSAKQDELRRKQRLESMRTALSVRPYAVEIFDLKILGNKGPEIREKLGITVQQYDSTMKWIFRTLRAGDFPL
jgi:DNA-directed RNA polymerase specialized sigma24 family protein